MSVKEIKVTLVRSKFGRTPGHRQCVEGLGLRKINQTVQIEDTPCNRGMINKVNHLIEVKEVK